jgi:hypothetical protein
VKRAINRLWLVLFSVGWLVPFTYSIASAYDFLDHWVWPAAAFNDFSAVVPFHPFRLAEPLLYGSVGWLAVVIICWVLRATRSSPEC